VIEFTVGYGRLVSIQVNAPAVVRGFIAGYPHVVELRRAKFGKDTASLSRFAVGDLEAVQDAGEAALVADDRSKLLPIDRRTI
jgi:hypothetical protein